jgi:hypothetical protein
MVFSEHFIQLYLQLALKFAFMSGSSLMATRTGDDQ